MKPNHPDSCPECGASRLLVDAAHGETVCAACGLVLADHMVDQGPEWRSFDAETRASRERTGAPLTLLRHDRGLSSEIDARGRDAAGKRLSADARRRYARLRTVHRRTRTRRSRDRSLVLAFSEIERVGSVLDLPRPLREAAAGIYRRAADAGLPRGRSIEGVVAASVYAACRDAGHPRTLDEIAAAARLPKNELARTYRTLARELALKIAPATPAQYLPRTASRLGLKPETEALALALLRRVEAAGLAASHAPFGTVAAVVYLATQRTGDHRTQDEVAEAAGVTPVTIRSRVKEIAEATA